MIPGAVFALVLLPLTLIAAVLVVVAWRGERRFLQRAHRTDGTVTSIAAQKWGHKRNPNPILFPVIRFKTERGETFSVKSRTGSGRSPYAVGQTVPILYDPGNPRNMRTDDLGGRWIGVMIAGAFLLVCLFFDTLAIVGR